jgi:hypothetical protein
MGSLHGKLSYHYPWSSGMGSSLLGLMQTCVSLMKDASASPPVFIPKMMLGERVADISCRRHSQASCVCSQ